MKRLLAKVDAVLAGSARPYTRPRSMSAIDKRPVDGPVVVRLDGIAGDEQGDRRVHGGPDKAVHHYAFDHYAAWRRELGTLGVLEGPGAFGENLSTHGLTEAGVCLADRLRIGSVLLEVSQGRQPCWKLNDRFGRPDMARRVQLTQRTGWYYRVIESGVLEAGDAIHLIARPFPDWPLTRLLALLYDATLERRALEQALELPLVPSWRGLIERRLAQGAVEDWSRRLEGP